MSTFLSTLPASTTGFFAENNDFVFADTRQGDSGNAWFCAEASALAYKDPAFILEVAPRLGEPWSVKVFNADPTLAVLLLSESVAVLAFRGTRVAAFPDLLRPDPINLQDLTTDFSVRLGPPPPGQVHSGFLKAYNDFWNVHRKEILDLTTHRSLFLTGHSLGAAIATVAARDLQLIRALYTFGSPTVGDADFARGFQAIGLPVFRFVHEHDLVTTVPLPEMHYQHVGDILHIVGDADAPKLTRDPQHTLPEALKHNVAAIPEDIMNRFSGMRGIIDSGFTHFHLPGLADLNPGALQRNLLSGIANFPLPVDALADHAPTNYTTKLKKISDGGRNLPP